MRPDTPSLWILSVMCVGGWFVGLPLGVSANEDFTLLGGFAFVWGLTLASVLFVAGLMALDAWWLKRKDNPAEPHPKGQR